LLLDGDEGQENDNIGTDGKSKKKKSKKRTVSDLDARGDTGVGAGKPMSFWNLSISDFRPH